MKITKYTYQDARSPALSPELGTQPGLGAVYDTQPSLERLAPSPGLASRPLQPGSPRKDSKGQLQVATAPG